MTPLLGLVLGEAGTSVNKIVLADHLDNRQEQGRVRQALHWN